jgi:hypothetical protein
MLYLVLFLLFAPLDPSGPLRTLTVPCESPVKIVYPVFWIATRESWSMCRISLWLSAQIAYPALSSSPYATLDLPGVCISFFRFFGKKKHVIFKGN